MAKKDGSKRPKFKESAHRSKLKIERENRLRSKHKQSQKKKLNQELFEMVKTENIDQLDINSKKKTITQLYNLIVSFPEQNYDKIDLLLYFMQDNNVKILMRTMKMVKNLFIDIMPSYKIREEEDSKNNTNKNKQLSKQVEGVQTYERSLLKYYEKFINMLSIFLKTFSSSRKSASKESISKLLQFIIEIICQLFEKFYLFNCEDVLYKIIVEKLSDPNPKIRKSCHSTLLNVLSIMDNSKNMLDMKYSIINMMSHIIFTKPHDKFDPHVLELLSCHKIEFPDLVKQKDEISKLNDIKLGPREKRRMETSDQFQTKQQVHIEKRKQKELNKEKIKIIKNLHREMGEYENYKNDKCTYNMNLKILQKILLVFFDILKRKRDSPLMRGVLNGIGVLCDNINVEILIDLQTCIYEFVNFILEKQEDKKKKIFSVSALKSCLNITEKLTKDIISLEDSNLINSTYFFISKIVENQNCLLMTTDDLFILLEILDKLLLKNRVFSLDNVAAFVKRLAIFINSLDETNVPAFLLFIKRILQKYPSLSSMKESDDDLFDYSILTDPSLCNGKQSNIYSELQLLNNKSSNKLIKKLIEYLIKDEKNNPQMASLNFYDVLLSSKK